ncbi:MAG: biotin/lipoyl-binding protein [Firmicutes bacterium]|nr:biotin/lipoyl-binding protein [Bacillota bacterium]
MKTFKVTVDGQTYSVQVEEEAPDSQPVVTNTPAAPAAVPATNSAPAKASPPQENTNKSAAASGGSASINAPMPGSVLEVKVAVGDSVNEGDVLLVLEAMKMENELTAPQAGSVGQVLVKKGDTVNSGDPLIVLN